MGNGGHNYHALIVWRLSHKRPLAERFWSKVVKGHDCWIWTGARNKFGYGQLWVEHRKRAIRASAISWYLAHGYWVTTAQHLCHHCDNPPCVRPDHLFIGDAKSNMRDAIAKGRFKFLAPSLGVRNNLAKMTPAKVRDARRRHAKGETISALSRRFGLARSTVREIVNGRNWKEPGTAVIPRGRISAKLSQSEREQIRQLFDSGMKRAELARNFGVDAATINRHLGFK